MKKVNAYFFCDLGAALQPLTQFDTGTLFNWSAVTHILRARPILETFLKGHLVDLDVCVAAGNDLNAALDEVVPDPAAFLGESAHGKIDNRLLGCKGFSIGERARAFLGVLAAELENADTYYVPQKGIFDTDDLINSTVKIFSVRVREKLSPEAHNDIQQAGRCLAFELPTACGFHLMRVLESAMHAYHVHLTGRRLMLKASERSFGNYIAKLKEATASDTVLSVLEHIRILHRSPLMHPNVLSAEEVQALWSVVESAVACIYNDMGKREAAPAQSAPPVEAAPAKAA